jgi:hypothetical protein
MFNDHYIDWRIKRISKILELYGKDFFNNKSILELGCGLGDIGKEFISFGADVTFAEGRSDHCKKLKEKFPTSEIINLNQNKIWELEKRFDIVIHWGVLYHLNDWKSDLISTLKHSDLIFLESEVSDSDDVNFDLKIKEKDGYDQALDGIGSRPSANNVELFIKNLGFDIERFDDENLNSSFHQYSWKVTNTDTWRHGLRRFWIIKKCN